MPARPAHPGVALRCQAGCVKTPPGPKIDPSLAALIPPDTILLAGARLDQLQKTSLYEKHLANRTVPLIDDFPKQIGLKVRRQDLWELLLISDGKQSVVLGRGKFADEAEPDIERPGWTRFGYKGYNLVGDESEAVLLVSPTVIGVGPTPALRSLIDNKGKSQRPAFGPGRSAQADARGRAVLGGVQRGRTVASVQPTRRYGQRQQDHRFHSVGLGVPGVARRSERPGYGKLRQRSGRQESLRRVAGAGGPRAAGGSEGSTGRRARILDGLRITQESHKVNIHIEEPEELVETLLDLSGVGAGELNRPPQSVRRQYPDGDGFIADKGAVSVGVRTQRMREHARAIGGRIGDVIGRIAPPGGFSPARSRTRFAIS